MQRFGVFVLFVMLCLGSMAAAGCAPRVLATVQANAEPMPVKLTWAAVSGPGLSASVPQTRLVVDEVAASLASALSLYNWKWLSNPDQAAQADVLVRIWWLAEGPQYVMERNVDPFFGPPYGSGVSVGIGTGGFFGRRRWRPFGYYGYGYAEPAIQAVYSRRLIVEALRADALPRATREALLPPAQGQGFASGAAVAPDASGAIRRAVPQAAPAADPAKGPYAPPLALDGGALSRPPYAAPLTADGGDPSKEAPFAPPLLDSAAQGVPPEAVLWRVVVTSGGSTGDTRAILPQLAAAAAQAVGKNMQADVIIDSDMHVTYSQ